MSTAHARPIRQRWLGGLCIWIAIVGVAILIPDRARAGSVRTAQLAPSLGAAPKPAPRRSRSPLLAALPAAGGHAMVPSLGIAGLAFAPAPSPPRGVAVPSQPVAPTDEDDDEDDDDEEAPASKLLRSRSAPPLWIDRTYDTHRTRAIAFPPLFVHRTPAADHPEKQLHVDLALTFGWYSKKNQARRWLSPVGLFYGSFSKRKTLWGTLPLLMAYRRTGEQFTFVQFPLVFWWGTKYVKNLVVTPFHYQQVTPDSKRAISGLLVWYGHKRKNDALVDNDLSWLVVAPAFVRVSKGLRRVDFAFLYFGAENKAKGRSFGAITPLVLWHRSEYGNRRELWTAAWIQRSDKARGRSAWAIPPLLTFRHRDRDREILAATPLVWRSRNFLAGSTLWLAGPVGRYDDPDQTNSFGFPLWWRFHDKRSQATTSVLAPFAVARRTPTRRAVWTIFGGGAKGTTGTSVALPLVLSGGTRHADGGVTAGALGLFWYAHRPGSALERRTTFVAAPLGFWDRKGDRRRGGIIPLLTFAGARGSTRWQTVTPLFWHVGDRTTGRQTVVLGNVYHHQTKAGFEGGLVPLAFWGGGSERRYGIAPLLLSGHVTDVKAKTALTITPLFVRSKTPESRTLGFGLIAWDQRRGKDEHTTGVFPLFFHRRRGDDRLLVLPLGGMKRQDGVQTMVIGPVVGRTTATRKVWGVAPLLWRARERRADGVVDHVSLIPLFFRHRAPEGDLDMYSPLVWRSEVRGDRPRKGVAVVPFYFGQRQRGGVDVDAGLGFFWSRDRTRRTHTLIAGPFYHRLSRTSLHAGVAPLSWWMDSQTKRRLIALPAIVHVVDKVKREHTTVAIPFWFDRGRANGRRTWFAFPFVAGGKRLYNFTRFSIAPPGFFDIFRLQRNSRFTGFVPLLFRYRKCGYRMEDDPKCTYTLWGSAPLFVYGKDGMGRRTHGSLLYVFDRRKDGYRLYTPLFGINNVPGKTLGWYAGPLAVKTTNTHTRALLFPLFYRRAHRVEDQSLTLAVPPLFISRHRKDRRFLEAGLVFWQVRQQHKVSTAVLPPLFFHSHAYAQRRLTWVLPLFLRDDNYGEDQAWTAVTPLYVQRRRGANLDFVAFPLLWHIERGENQGTFGAFLWYDVRHKGRIVQMVPGAFLRVAGRRGDTRIIGPGLGWWTEGRGSKLGDFHWRVLLGLFGGGTEAGRRYATVFGARVDRGPAGPRMPSTKRAARRAEREARKAARVEARSARQAARRAKSAAAAKR